MSCTPTTPSGFSPHTSKLRTSPASLLMASVKTVAMSIGIRRGAYSESDIVYTGLVELLASAFLFNSQRVKDLSGRFDFGIICTLLGAGIMTLLGKWA